MEEFNYQGSPKQNEDVPNRAARTVNILNAIALVLMVFLCLITDGAFLAFFIGFAMGIYNLVSLIVFVVQKNVPAYVSNIVWMLLMPIIGFGCCAMGFNNSWH